MKQIKKVCEAHLIYKKDKKTHKELKFLILILLGVMAHKKYIY
jgi:hypothetical protein